MAATENQDSTLSTEHNSPTQALALATAAFAVAFAAWSLIAPLGAGIQRELGLSELQTSVLIAVPVILGSLLRLPLGILTDRYGGRRVFTLLLLLTVPALLLLSQARSYAMLLLGGLWLGLGGASFAVGVPFVSRYFPPERQGFALGVYGAGNIGTALAARARSADRVHLGARRGLLCFRRAGHRDGRNILVAGARRAGAG